MKNNGLLAKLSLFVDTGSLTEDELRQNISHSKVDTDNAENRWLVTVQNSEKPLRSRIATWLAKSGVEIFGSLYRVAAILICLTLIGVLLSVVTFMPPFADAGNPEVNEVPERYVSKSIEETGAANAVSGMISAYRGFDTLGEAHVLFVASCSVIVLLRVDPEERKRSKGRRLNPDLIGEDMAYEPNTDLILRKTAKLLVPLSFIFGLYVILNGASSPGGGFSGGAIIGAGLILNSVAFGFQRTERFFNDEIYHLVKTACLTLYALMMAYFIYMGANGFYDGVWLGNPGNIISGGLILPINIVVGLEVACTLYCFYALFRKGGL